MHVLEGITQSREQFTSTLPATFNGNDSRESFLKYARLSSFTRRACGVTNSEKRRMRATVLSYAPDPLQFVNFDLTAHGSKGD